MKKLSSKTAKSTARKTVSAKVKTENVKVKAAKTPRTDAYASKLDASKAEQIRERASKGEPISHIAKDMGVAFGSVRAVVELRSYKPEGIRTLTLGLNEGEFARLQEKAEKKGQSVIAFARAILAKY